MDPQIKSVATSVLMTLAGSLATVGVAHGIIPEADKASATNIIVSVVLYVVTAGLAWYKARQVTPTAAIAQVNNQDNGVKVVAESEPAPMVTQPLKGA